MSNEAQAALTYAANLLREQSDNGGYGFYRPANPNDFYPDHESCSAVEIANHKAACDAYDKGARRPCVAIPEQGSGWVHNEKGDGVLHITTAPWGIGSYNETDEEMLKHATTLRDMVSTLADHDAKLRAANERIAALEATLKGIANANPLNWDAPHNDTKSFQDWAQSRARAALATNQDTPALQPSGASQ